MTQHQKRLIIERLLREVPALPDRQGLDRFGDRDLPAPAL